MSVEIVIALSARCNRPVSLAFTRNALVSRSGGPVFTIFHIVFATQTNSGRVVREMKSAQTRSSIQ